ncbi:RND family transporter [Haloglomus irregulare]|uniref:RND family transporter n=1 Tax=Haloglomus irregulare TaxID=2234134 RepID=A0A554MU19_9EURY|nr:hydrophobe/amphiphile efflux-3 (HAE3) family transporter [Haloglomus irregulare]TSD08628.1 RND family transporter [Haloglomus irregulare]
MIDLRDALERSGRWSATHRRTVVAAVLIIAIISGGVAAAGLQMSMGMSLYVDDDSQVAEDWATVKEDHGVGNAVFIVIESNSLYDPETVRAIDRLDHRYAAIDDVSSVTTLAEVVRLGNDGSIPNTEDGVRRAIKQVRQQPGGDQLVDRVVPEAGTTVIVAQYGEVDRFDRGAFLPTRGSDIINNEVRQETDLAELPPGTSTTITGQPVFENAAFGLMLPEMIMLFAGAFALIFAVVYFVMRGRLARGREVAMPLGVAILSLVYMAGTMGVLGYSFNAIMLGVMPVAMGLGIDYSLQIQTRYAEARENGQSPVTAAGTASRTTGRALLIAMGTTVAGLGSLLVSPVPPVQQFGVTSAIAVLSSMILSVTLLPALLVRFDVGPPREASGTEGDRVEQVFQQLTSRVAAGRPIVTLLFALLIVSGGAYAYPQVEPRQEMMDFWPQNMEAKNDLDRLSETVESPKRIYVLVETDQAYTPQTFRDVAEFQRVMLDNSQVNGVRSAVTAVALTNDGRVPETEAELDAALAARTGSGSLTVADPDRRPSRLVLTFAIEDVKGEATRTLIEEFEGNAELTLRTADEVRVTGKPVLNRMVIENVTAGLIPMTLLSFALGGGFLALAFRSVRISAVLVGSVAGTAALAVAGLMYVLSIPWNPLTITMSSIALGVGVDYGVHVFERYEHEVKHGASDRAAASTAVAKLARPVLGSSLTTIFGFGVLTVSRFPVLANFGLVTVFAIGLALAGAFLVLPASLVLVPGLVRRPPETAAPSSIESETS